MSSYILVLEEKIKAFSLIGSGNKSSISISIKGDNTPLKVLESEDRILGYVAGNTRMFCYCFIAERNSDEEVYFDKTLETKIGAPLELCSQDIQTLINTKEQTDILLPISDEQYSQIYSLMVNSLSENEKEIVNAEVIVEKIPDNLSISELGQILYDMYKGYDSNAIRVFGIKYGKIIVSNDYACSAIVKASGIKGKNGKESTYDSEVSKGVQIYKSLLKNEFGIRFVNEDNSPTNSRLQFKSGLQCDLPRNRIVFGAPGTGKSFAVNSDRKELLGETNEDDYERVTFHPDYSYANFVGTYKPVMKNKVSSTHDPDVDYVLSVLNDKSKDAQEKYDILFDKFKDDRGMGKLSVLLSLYTDEPFKPKNKDGSGEGFYSNEQNYGKAIKKYVDLRTLADEGGDISYEYVPGPFMRMYVKALRNAKSGNPKPYVLIIEEINRANVAAVFGEIFQLLDRGKDYISEYPIQASEDIKKYLSKELGGKPNDYSQLRIPDNMFIWATMNSADQGVFPMDTAFKRRWEFTYLGIDENDNDIQGKYVVIGAQKQKVEWNALRKAINEFLANEKINEDKQLGPYFISRNIVVPSDGGNEIDSKKFCDAFKNKVLMYLFEDAAKQKRAKLFEGCDAGQNRYSKICEAFDEKGIGIFAADIRNNVHLQNVDTNAQTPNEKDSDNN